MPVYIEPSWPEFPAFTEPGTRLVLQCVSLDCQPAAVTLYLGRNTGGGDGSDVTVMAITEERGRVVDDPACIEPARPCEIVFTLPLRVPWRGSWEIRLGSDGVVGVREIRLVLARCDWNHDGVRNSADFFDFMADFFAGHGDFNVDGVTDQADLDGILECGL